MRVDWPASGLTPIWKQPAGAGYASFVIARNRAFTIEQRGPNEVVAAYDVASGRELWTNTWPAEFRESMAAMARARRRPGSTGDSSHLA